MSRTTPSHLRCLAAALGLLLLMQPGLALGQEGETLSPPPPPPSPPSPHVEGPSTSTSTALLPAVVPPAPVSEPTVVPDPAPAPAPVPRLEPVERRAERGLFGGYGAGLATFGIPGLGQGGIGLLLEAYGGGRFNDHFSLKLSGDWGLTHFFRTAQAAALGAGLGGWAVRAYGNVTSWAGTGRDEWAIFRLMGAFMGYVLLLVPLVFAGLLVVVSPLASTSFTEAALTAGLHLPRGNLDLFLEGGLGLMAYAERRGGLRGGWGPIVGAGAKVGPASLRVHLIYSPDLMNESNGTGVFAGGITLGISDG